MPGKNRPPNEKEAVIKVSLTPETWIIAPICTKQQLQRYYEKGWITEEDRDHLDRAFPRDHEGRPVIFKLWLLSPMKRACDKLGYPKSVLDFSIVDEKGFPVEYIVIPDKPLTYRRAILGESRSTEYYEYIDGTYTLEFTVKTRHPKELCEILNAAGRIGLMARSNKGFGKFRVSFKVENI